MASAPAIISLYADAIHIGKNVLASYENGEVGEIYLAYTSFKNTVVQEEKLIKLLPMAIHFTVSSPKCWETSTVNSPPFSVAIVIASLISVRVPLHRN